MENNYQIDAAKTMYMPTRPKWFKELVVKYTNTKLPAFFEFAKDKEKHQVSERNNAFVNRIFCNIKDKPINTRALKLGKINCGLMMSNPNVRCSKEVSEIYDRLNKEYRFMINMKDEYIDNLRYVACKLRSEFSDTGYSDEMITDMLVHYLYGGKDKRYKQLLWFCYGQRVANNIESHVVYDDGTSQEKIIVEKTKDIQCVDCGRWFEIKVKDNRTCRCPSCMESRQKILHIERNKRHRDKHANDGF